MEAAEIEKEFTDLKKVITNLQERVAELEAGDKTKLELLKKVSDKVDGKTEAKAPAKKLVTPDATFKIGDGEYKFTAPNFFHNTKLYISEEIMAHTKANAGLFKELVENQTHKGGAFSAGLLKKVN